MGVGQYRVQVGDGHHPVIDPVRAAAGAVHTGDGGGAQGAELAGKGGTDVSGTQQGKVAAPDGAHGKLVGPAPALHYLGILRHPPHEHDRHHDQVLGDGDAVGAGGVGEQAVRIGEDAVIFAVGVRTGKGAAVPLERGRRCPEKLGGVGEEHLAVLHAGAGLIELVQGEKVGREAGGLGRGTDGLLVGIRQEFQVNTNITGHREPSL